MLPTCDGNDSHAQCLSSLVRFSFLSQRCCGSSERLWDVAPLVKSDGDQTWDGMMGGTSAMVVLARPSYLLEVS
jgi:hypothetical protein